MIEFTSYASGSSGNLYKVTSDTCTLMIEAGVRLTKISEAFKYQVSGISGALISHSHKDHAKSVDDVARLGVDCYMTRETAEELKFQQEHRLKIITPLKKFDIDKLQVLAFPTVHDSAGSVGFLIADNHDKLLFATDTQCIVNQFRGLTIIAIECNWSESTWADEADEVHKRRVIDNHMSLERVKEFLEVTKSKGGLSRLREIHLLHLSDSNADAELFKTEIQKLTGVPVWIA